MCTSGLSTSHSTLDLCLKAESTCLGRGHASHIQTPTLLGSTSSELPGLKNRRRRQRRSRRSSPPWPQRPTSSCWPWRLLWPSCSGPPDESGAYKHGGDFSAEPWGFSQPRSTLKWGSSRISTLLECHPKASWPLLPGSPRRAGSPRLVYQATRLRAGTRRNISSITAPPCQMTEVPPASLPLPCASGLCVPCLVGTGAQLSSKATAQAITTWE